MRKQGIGLGLAGATIAMLLATNVSAAEVSAEVSVIAGDHAGTPVGDVRFFDTRYGLLIFPNLHGLTPGPHGTHVHQFPDCGAKVANGQMTPGGAAGDHLDPQNTKRHGGPYGNGHLGDLPNLIVEANGTATIPVLAPRLKVADIVGHALMIHGEADRYGDEAPGAEAASHHAMAMAMKMDDKSMANMPGMNMPGMGASGAKPGTPSMGGMRMYCGVIK